MVALVRGQQCHCTLTAAGSCVAARSSVPPENQLAVASSNGWDPKLLVGPLESRTWAATGHRLPAELTCFAQKGRPLACARQPHLDGRHDVWYPNGLLTRCWTIHDALVHVRQPLLLLPATSAQIREVHAVAPKFWAQLKSLTSGMMLLVLLTTRIPGCTTLTTQLHQAEHLHQSMPHYILLRLAAPWHSAIRASASAIELFLQ